LKRKAHPNTPSLKTYPMNDYEVYEIDLPQQYVDIELTDAIETYLFGSRGSFKSTNGIGMFVRRRVFGLPRSTGVGVGLSFAHLYENTLPAVKAFFISHGYVEGVHFAICSPPPKNWIKPYAGVLDKKFTNTWTWYNGTQIQFVSLHRKASANGISAQWGFFDECKFMDETELVDEIFPIIRPNKESDKYFKGCSGYMSKFFATDKNADPAQLKWLLKKREHVDHNTIEVVQDLQSALNELKEEYDNATKRKKEELKVFIHADEVRLATLRDNLVYVAEINVDDVRPLLGDVWYNDKKRNSSERDWKVIYLNQDPDRPGEAFYPAWKNEVHVYDIDDDVDPSAPFIISSDYQHTVSPIPISQKAKLPGNEKVTHNYVDEVYTLNPEGLRAAVKKFCEKYKFHSNKIVYYVYDHTAIGKENEADEPCKKVIDELRKHGWTVIEIYTGQAPGHYDKYLDTIDWMENKDGEHTDIRINKRCKKLIISITGAGAVTQGKETKKDKKYENTTKFPKLDQSETTHFSDAFDMINDAVHKQKLIKSYIERRPLAFR
jgi:hypothetical protein